MQTLQQAIGSGALPQPWTGHRGVVPVDESFVAAVRAGAVVEFATAPAADAPRCRGQLTADQVRQVWWWNVFNLQGRNVLTRELLEDEVAPMVQRLVDPRLVDDEGQLDAAGGRMSAVLAKARAAAELLSRIRAQPLLDAVVSPLERIRIAAVMRAKSAQYASGGPALERMRLAREILELMARLGVVANEDPATKALRASLAESEDRAKAAR